MSLNFIFSLTVNQLNDVKCVYIQKRMKKINQKNKTQKNEM